MGDGIGSRRRDLLRATGVAVATAVAGCNGGDDETTTTRTTDEDGGTTTTATPVTGEVVVLTTGPLATLDPVAAADPASIAVVEHVADGLTRFPDGATSAEPSLAADVSTSAEFETYTFEIAEDARFHDGSPVTADDVVYSFERVAGSRRSRWRDLALEELGLVHETDADGEYVPGSLGVTAVDERTVELDFVDGSHGKPSLLAYPAFSVVPEGVVGDVEGYDGQRPYEEFAADPVGCGPFELVDWDSGNAVEVASFDGYHGGEVAPDGVRWAVFADEVAAHEFGLGGDADLVPVPDGPYRPEGVAVDRTDPRGREFGSYDAGDGRRLDYLSVPLVDTFYLAFDMASVPRVVRRAVALAVDLHRVVEEAIDGRAAPAYHLTPPAVFPGQGYATHAEAEYPHGYARSRAEEAEELLERAGYGRDDRYRLELTRYQSPTWEAIADFVGDLLLSAHVEVVVDDVPISTLRDRARTGDLEAYTFGRVPERPSPEDFVELVAPGRTDPGGDDSTSYIDWERATSEGMAEAADRAAAAYGTVRSNPIPTALAREARNEAYVAMEEANWEDVGILPVYHRVQERFAHQWVRVDPFGGMGSQHQVLDGTEVGDRGG